MSRKLNIASSLLFLTAIMPVFNALLMMFSGSSEFTYEELVGVSVGQIRELSPKLWISIELAIQLRGLYLLIFAFLWMAISLIPYRKGEKWAWYAIFGVGSIWLSGYLILVYIGLAAGIYLITWIIPGFIWFTLWVIGLALPAKEFFSKP
jgi:hypothetical protein